MKNCARRDLRLVVRRKRVPTGTLVPAVRKETLVPATNLGRVAAVRPSLGLVVLPSLVRLQQGLVRCLALASRRNSARPGVAARVVPAALEVLPAARGVRSADRRAHPLRSRCCSGC